MTLPFSSLANPDRDRELSPCLRCHAAYNIPGRRSGPTCITFTVKSHAVICLNCWYHSLPGEAQDEAIANHNEGRTKVNISKRREELGLSIPEAAKAAGVGSSSWKEWETGIRGYT
jgi:recombinational DNA repair protein (RecF pathway)